MRKRPRDSQDEIQSVEGPSQRKTGSDRRGPEMLRKRTTLKFAGLGRKVVSRKGKRVNFEGRGRRVLSSREKSES